MITQGLHSPRLVTQGYQSGVPARGIIVQGMGSPLLLTQGYGLVTQPDAGAVSALLAISDTARTLVALADAARTDISISDRIMP